MISYVILYWLIITIIHLGLNIDKVKYSHLRLRDLINDSQYVIYTSFVDKSFKNNTLNDKALSKFFIAYFRNMTLINDADVIYIDIFFKNYRYKFNYRQWKWWWSYRERSILWLPYAVAIFYSFELYHPFSLFKRIPNFKLFCIELYNNCNCIHDWKQKTSWEVFLSHKGEAA